MRSGCRQCTVNNTNRFSISGAFQVVINNPKLLVRTKHHFKSGSAEFDSVLFFTAIIFEQLLLLTLANILKNTTNITNN